MQRYYQKYKDKGFTVLGVSIDDESGKKAWLKAISDDKLPWTQVADLKGSKNAVKLLYGINLIPANILVDPSGKIVARNLRDKALHETLAQLLN